MVKIILGLWIFNLANWYLAGSQLNVLGIVPRTLFGLVGIIFSPFLHANFNHLFFNSLPLFALGLLIAAQNYLLFLWITAFIMVLNGLGVWLIGRRGNHIGASGLIAGYFAFLITMAYQKPGIITLFLGGISIYYFGGIFLSLFPTEDSVSWEGHVTGFLAGLLTAYIIAIA